MPLMGSEDLQNLLKNAAHCVLVPGYDNCAYGQVFGDIPSFGTARRVEAPPCPSTRTRCHHCFFGACAKWGGYMVHATRYTLQGATHCMLHTTRDTLHTTHCMLYTTRCSSMLHYVPVGLQGQAAHAQIGTAQAQAC